MARLISAIRRNRIGNVLVDVFDWYPSHLSSVERKLLRKLDLSILVFATLSFFCKYLDQSNITNAYVSGLKEDLHADGNALNYFNVAYYTAYVVGQIPLVALQSRPDIAPYFLPALEIIWAVLTFAQSRVTKLWQLYLIRALVGFFEAPSFAGTHLILGSWYRPEELFKRAGTWFMGNSLGSMFSGYLQAAAYRNLNGVKGLSGWRWLFIIDGVITLPIAFLGFLFFPGLPNSRKPWFLTAEEHALSTSRLPRGHRQASAEGVSFKSIKRTLTQSPIWYLCVVIYICLIQAHYWTGYMTLWLKSLAPKYSVEKINTLPTFINLLSAFSSWFGTTLAGSISVWKLFTFPQIFMAFSLIVLTVWNVPDGLKFVAFYFGGFSGMTSPILYSWINTILRGDTESRAFVFSSMMTLGYSTYIWVPLFTFPTVEAPRFPNGYPASLAFLIAMWVFMMIGCWRWRTPGSATINADEEERAEIAGATGVRDSVTDGLEDEEARVDRKSLFEDEAETGSEGPRERTPTLKASRGELV